MTRRPKLKSAKAKRARRSAPRTKAPSKPAKASAKPAKPAKPDPLDEFVAAAALSLDLPCAAAWIPGITANVRLTLQHAALVAAFPLPDEAEPAPVFEA